MIVGRTLELTSFALRHHRDTYQWFSTKYLLARQLRQKLLHWKCQPANAESVMPVRAMTSGPRQHFFSYYDKCPWDQSNSRLLALQTPVIYRVPRPGDEVTIG